MKIEKLDKSSPTLLKLASFSEYCRVINKINELIDAFNRTEESAKQARVQELLSSLPSEAFILTDEKVQKILDEVTQKLDLEKEKPPQILPCPFCNSEAILHKYRSMVCEETDLYFISCSRKDCGMRLSYEERTKKDCIKKWNRRV